MQLYELTAFDQLIFSEYPLTGTPIRTRGSAELHKALTVVAGDATLSAEWHTSGAYSVGPEGVLIRINGLADFRCRTDGLLIHVSAVKNATLEEISGHILANAIPAALWLQGRNLLHAGAALLPMQAKAVVIAGPSRSGKSTVLLSLLRAGAAIVSEDAACLGCEGDQCHVSGFSDHIHLREVETNPDERQLLDVPKSMRRTKELVGAVVTLEMSGANGSAIPKLLRGATALEALLRNRYRQVVPRLIGREAADLQTWAALAASVPVYSWSPRHTDQNRWSSILAALVE